MPRRALVFALLALAVPLPALALTGDGDEAAAGSSLSVSASLGGCGTATDTIVCRIDATWNTIPGATRYTASVTRADGSVMDVGEVGAGSASLWVPYVGNGTYTVTVSAYGSPPGQAREKVLAQDTSEARTGDRRARESSSYTGAVEDPGAAGDPATPDDGVVEPVDPTDADCEEPPAPEEPAPAPEETGEAQDAAALAPEDEAAPDDAPEVSEPVECSEVPGAGEGAAG